MTNKELIEKLEHYATLPNYYDNRTTAWLTWNKSKGAWPADCIRGPKGIIYWGWAEDKTKAHGGAVYDKSTDFTEDAWIAHCDGVSANFASITPGELLYMPGHCGVYIGNWTVFEITTGWGVNGAILSEIDANGRRTLGGVPAANAYWKKHGRIPEIKYINETEEEFDVATIWTVKEGSEGGHVESLQALLNEKNHAGLYVDGICGPITAAAIYSYQMKHGLYTDAVCGPKTWFDIMCRDCR